MPFRRHPAHGWFKGRPLSDCLEGLRQWVGPPIVTVSKTMAIITVAGTTSTFASFLGHQHGDCHHGPLSRLSALWFFPMPPDPASASFPIHPCWMLNVDLCWWWLFDCVNDNCWRGRGSGTFLRIPTRRTLICFTRGFFQPASYFFTRYFILDTS